MSTKQVWFITGAARGMGADIARAALAAGHRVVATGRNPDRVRDVLGERDDVLPVALDITDPDAARAAVDAAVEAFGGIDVLVNNAGVLYAGYFEEISPDQFRTQMETNFFGPLNVTRAVLPVMRKQRSGRVLTITSTAGLAGVDICTAYSAAKFALEGWMESLTAEVEPYGITTTIVEPGFFRTDLLVEGSSTIWAELSIPDYADRTAATIAAWKSMNGKQGGDPAKLATALVGLVDSDNPPLRWFAGAGAVQTAEQKAHDLLAQADAHREGPPPSTTTRVLLPRPRRPRHLTPQHSQKSMQVSHPQLPREAPLRTVAAGGGPHLTRSEGPRAPSNEFLQPMQLTPSSDG